MATAIARIPSIGLFAGANAMVVLAVVFNAVTPLVALVVLLPVLIAIAQRPQRGVLLLAGLIPFDGLLLIVGPGSSLFAGWKEALLLATLAATFVAPAEARASERRSLPKWAPAAFGLLGLGVASSLLIGGVQALWGLKVAYFWMLALVVIWRCPFSAVERDRFVDVLMVCGFVTAVVGLAQQAIGPQGLYELGYEYNKTIRTTGGLLRSFSTFENPFGYGYFLMVVLLVGLVFALGEPKRVRSKVFLLATPVLALGLAVSFVRGAWLGFGAGLIYLGFTRVRAILLGLPLVAIGLLLLPSDVSTASLQGRSGGERVGAWQENITEILSHPLGVGIGSTDAAAERTAEITGNDDIFYPDNEYYKHAYELGILGAWFIIMLLVATFLDMRSRSRGPGGHELLALAATTNVLAAAVASFVTVFFDNFPTAVYFWLILGIVVAGQGPPIVPSWARRGSLLDAARNADDAPISVGV